MVIEGPRGWDAGFIRGFLKGRDLHVPVFQAEEEGFQCEPLMEKVAQMMRSPREVLHLLVPEEAVGLVREAAKEGLETGEGIDVLRERVLAGARFRFWAEVFSPEHGERIRGLFRDLPEGVRTDPATTWTERKDPSGKGTELYAPVHDYELHGHGVVEGDFEPVLDLYRTCRGEELIRVEKAELIPAT